MQLSSTTLLAFAALTLLATALPGAAAGRALAQSSGFQADSRSWSHDDKPTVVIPADAPVPGRNPIPSPAPGTPPPSTSPTPITGGGPGSSPEPGKESAFAGTSTKGGQTYQDYLDEEAEKAPKKLRYVSVGDWGVIGEWYGQLPPASTAPATGRRLLRGPAAAAPVVV